jgi:tetratricopeptide (TPR) repeat protein
MKRGLFMSSSRHLRFMLLLSFLGLAIVTYKTDFFKALTSPPDAAAPPRDYAWETPSYPEKTLSGSFLAGRVAQNEGDWARASEFLKEAIQDDPENMDLKRRAMILVMGSGQAEQAITMARDAIAAGDKTSLPRLFLLLEPLKKNDFAAARSEAAAIPEDGISEFVTPLVRGWAAAGLKQKDVAGLQGNVVHLYHALLIADYIDDKATLASLAQKDYMSLGLSLRALVTIADIFKRHGLEKQSKALHEQIAILTKNASESIEAEPRITSPVQGVAKSFLDMAIVLYRDYPDSSRLFAYMALYLDPSLSDTFVLMGQMAADAGRFDEAIQAFQRIDTSKDPELQIRVERQIAELLAQHGKKDQAIERLTDLVTRTKNIDAQIQIGDIYRNDDQYKEALEAYNVAFRMLDNNVTAQYWNLVYARGMVNERLGNWDAAEKDLKKALEFQPENPYILNYLGYSWVDQGLNLDKAAELIEKAVKLQPDDGYIVDSLGWVYYLRGNYARAVEVLEQAVALVPHDPTINDHLGDAYWKVGRRNEARFQWKRALSFNPEDKDRIIIEQKIENGLPDKTAP